MIRVGDRKKIDVRLEMNDTQLETKDMRLELQQ
jgi:hypothetical protein